MKGTNENHKRLKPKEPVMKIKPVNVGSFFSGLETTTKALNNLGVPNKLKFICEMKPKLRQLVQMSHGPEVIEKDAFVAVQSDLSPVDLLQVSPPCQFLSPAGQQKGCSDERYPTLFIAESYLDKLADHEKPKAILMEESHALLLQKKFKAIRKKVVSGFKKHKYRIFTRILNTKDHGIPHNRPRAFVLALKLKKGREFSWPKKLSYQVPLSKLLIDPTKPTNDPMTAPSKTMTKRAQDIIDDALAQAQAKDIDTSKQTVFIDCGSTPGWSTWNVDRTPCLTASRAASGGHFMSTHNRLMDTEEIMRLQGFIPDDIKRSHIKRSGMNFALGNAISCNVLERLLPKVLWASGIVDKVVKDRWEDKAWVKQGAWWA